jgi:hypothetical protein
MALDRRDRPLRRIRVVATGPAALPAAAAQLPGLPDLPRARLRPGPSRPVRLQGLPDLPRHGASTAMTRRTYSAHGKGHRMLARLEAGPATTGELCFAADPRAEGHRRGKGRRVLEALTADTLARPIGSGFYVLTPAGADVLACLRGGHDAIVGGQALGQAA